MTHTASSLLFSATAAVALVSCIVEEGASLEVDSESQAISVASAARFNASATVVAAGGVAFPATFQADRVIALYDSDHDGVIDTAGGSRAQTFPTSVSTPFAAGARIGSSLVVGTPPGPGFCGDLIVLATDLSGPVNGESYFIWLALRTPAFVAPPGCHAGTADAGAGAFNATTGLTIHHETAIGGAANNSSIAPFTFWVDVSTGSTQYPGRLIVDSIGSAQLNQITGTFNRRINLSSISLDVPVIDELAWDGSSTFTGGAIASSSHPQATLVMASSTTGPGGSEIEEGRMHWADVSGDGRDDVCIVEEQEVACAVMGADRRLGAFRPWSGEFGWEDLGRWPYWNTVQFPDLDGDGDADLCASTSRGIRCAASSRTGFAASTLWDTTMTAAAGWTNGSWFPTIRFPDVNGDRRADLCGRAADGIHCAVGDGFTGFYGMTLTGARFSDARGWNVEDKWRTIQYADLDGDRRADVCARGGDGIFCARSLGNAFEADRRWHDNFTDAGGWHLPQYWRTIKLGDVNNDGTADLCGRGSAGMYCTPSLGGSFAPSLRLVAPGFSDVAGWSNWRYYATLMLIDVSGDGVKDICGRGIAGVWCATALPDPNSRNVAFSPIALWVSVYGDDPHRSPGSSGVGDGYWLETMVPANIDVDRAQEMCSATPWGIECTN